MAQMQVLQTFASPFYPQGRGQQSKYSNSRNGATPTPTRPWICNTSGRKTNFLATTPTGVLTAGTYIWFYNFKRCCTFMEKNEGVAPLRELLYSEPELLRIFLSVSSHASSSHRFRILWPSTCILSPGRRWAWIIEQLPFRSKVQLHRKLLFNTTGSNYRYFQRYKGTVQLY